MITIYHFEDGTSQAFCSIGGDDHWITRGAQPRAKVERKARRQREQHRRQIGKVEYRTASDHDMADLAARAQILKAHTDLIQVLEERMVILKAATDAERNVLVRAVKPQGETSPKEQL